MMWRRSSRALLSEKVFDERGEGVHMRLPIVLFASAVLVAVSAIAGRISMSHAAAGPSYTAARDVGTFLTQQELASISSLQPSYEGAYPGIANNIHSGWAPAG